MCRPANTRQFQVLINPVTIHLGTGTNLSDFATNRDLTCVAKTGFL